MLNVLGQSIDFWKYLLILNLMLVASKGILKKPSGLQTRTEQGSSLSQMYFATRAQKFIKPVSVNALCLRATAFCCSERFAQRPEIFRVVIQTKLMGFWQRHHPRF